MARIIISIIIFGAAVGVFFGLTVPALNNAKAESAKSAKLESAIKQFEELEKKRNEIVSKYGGVSPEDTKRLDLALPKQISAINLVIQIDDMAKSRGLLLRRIDIEEIKDNKKKELAKNGTEPQYKTATIVFSVTGSYEVFTSFLSDLEKSLQIMDIKEVSFSAGGKADSYDFSVRAVTYYAGD